VALFNNYIPAVGTPEVVTSGEQQEEKDFLDAILSTTIMKRTEEFLESKGLVPSGTFRAKFTEIWFGLYSRSGTVLGSSGFEHVFLGELKNGVSGFHGWAFFAQEEANTNLDYNGHLATLSLGSKGSVITHTFDWLNNKKPISSMFIGTSPEFDMAVFTVCWFARPNAKCPITLNGAKLNIQTYDITYGGKKYVASAYPDIPV
jgi:poly(U)-specific endoribonuclease